MDKSSKEHVPIEDQVQAWNAWNEKARGTWSVSAPESGLNATSRRQLEIVEQSIAGLNRTDLSILEVGCGTGWLCERLARFGHVTGTDLADEMLTQAAARWPTVNFVTGDFMKLDLPLASFDVVVTLEVLSHMADQPAFIARLAALLKPGGLLLLATQNRPVLERWSAIGGPIPGQLRRWVDAGQLRSLLEPHFATPGIQSVVPVGDQGYLRLVNSPRLNKLLERLVSADTIRRTKEGAMLGHTLVACAAKRM